MRFSFDWLCQYVDIGEAPSEVAARLTAAGLNVESLEEQAGDTLLEIEVTTNRPDCMAHLGLAREVAALYGRPLGIPPADLREGDSSVADLARLAVENGRDCPRYVARVVEDVRIGPSPDWLVRRLQAVGARPINNVVDITNFVLWELGQPIHAFDLDRLAGRRITVRRARAGEKLKTLDGQQRKLDDELLVIADDQQAVALAGIIGGLDTEVGADTKTVLIESAHFDPRRVRVGSRFLGLRTDASHRFERGADPGACRLAADRVAGLVAELAGGEIAAGALDLQYQENDWRLSGRLELDRLCRFAGIEIAPQQVERWLIALGFELSSDAPGVWQVTAPSWRFYDLRRDPERPPAERQGEIFEADLFEEVLRLHGFDDIPATLPAVAGPDEGSSADHWMREGLRQHLAACGYREAITFAFHERSADGRFPALARQGGPLCLANPLSELYTVMRRSLLPGLVEAAAFNQRRGVKGARFFEIGHLFPGGTTPEIESVALVAGGGTGSPWDRHAQFDLFDLKGTVESLAERAGVKLVARPAELAGFVAGTASKLFLRDDESVEVGFLGRLDQPDFPFALYGGELLTSHLAPSESPLVELPSRFPSIEGDITLTHGLAVAWSQIEDVIQRMELPDLVEFGVKDRYRGEGVADGAVNTTIYFLYNSQDRSLTQEEVNDRQAALRHQLEKLFGFRGSS